MKAGILIFPGINSDRDLEAVLRRDYGFETEYLWHTADFDLKHDLYFVPGGFSYGDYLRSGAMAARSKSIDSLRAAVDRGIPVTGICNGFQILTEAGLLPGALIRNCTLRHICLHAPLKGEGIFADTFPEDYRLPVSHSEGNYLCSEAELKELEDSNRIIMRYLSDINGSTASIAGIASENRRVVGLMPHPERLMNNTLDSVQSSGQPGRLFFDRLFEHYSL